MLSCFSSWRWPERQGQSIQLLTGDFNYCNSLPSNSLQWNCKYISHWKAHKCTTKKGMCSRKLPLNRSIPLAWIKNQTKQIHFSQLSMPGKFPLASPHFFLFLQNLNASCKTWVNNLGWVKEAVFQWYQMQGFFQKLLVLWYLQALLSPCQ